MADHDPWASTYEDHEAPRPPNVHLLATLSRLNPAPGGRALDLGCGSGRHFPALAQHGLSPIGVDLSAAAIARSHRFASRVPLAQASVDALPFADHTFDWIVAWGVLFHLFTDQLHRALREIRRTLAPQGTAILHALDPSDWRRDPNAGPAHRREIASRHVTGVIDSYYTPEEVAAMLAPHFEIVSREMVSTQHDYGKSAEWVIVVNPLPTPK
ncbi:MAG TPA: methyltransferase domain-containing protein [Anaerolineae bacterium]|nr:methyltransferase domain-containing protein [Anaerolineae bacterium]